MISHLETMHYILVENLPVFYSPKTPKPLAVNREVVRVNKLMEKELADCDNCKSKNDYTNRGSNPGPLPC